MRRPRTILIGQTIELIDGMYTLVGYEGVVFRLRNELTNEVVVLHQSELFRLMARGERLDALEEDSTTNEEDESTTRKKKQKVLTSLQEALDRLDADTVMLVPHLQELLDGTPVDGGELQAKYDPRLPMTGRLQAKMKELDDLGMPMPYRTLQRRFQRFKDGGVAALGDKRTHGRKEETFARADERVIAALRRVLKSYAGRSKTSYAIIRTDLKLELEDEFPHPNDRPALPSTSSVERYVKMLSGNQDPTTSAELRATAALVPKHTFRKRAVTAPGDECQMDTSLFDAFVRMPDGSVIRPHLTTLIDKRTRSIIGFNFTEGAPVGEDHAWLIARTLVPHALRPWSAQYAELELPEMPWAKFVEGEDHKYDTYRPYIFPRRILVDNGQDYRGIVVLGACNRYGMHITETPPRTPTGKPHVERHFSTIKTMFTRHLPGYAGGNLAERGVKPEEENVLELRTVIELFDRWVAIIWQNREHEGLTDPLEPTFVHSPNSMYAASLEYTGHFMLPLGEEDYIALMPRTDRTVQVDGIAFRGRVYDSPYLAPMRLQKDADGHSVKVAVHYDRHDPSQVWVLSPQDGQWITCGWTDDTGLLRPNERAMLHDAKKLAKATKRFTNDEAHDFVARTRREASAMEQQLKAEKAKSKKVVSPAALSDIEPVTDRSHVIDDYLNFDELSLA